jgi:hypothetical protein
MNAYYRSRDRAYYKSRAGGRMMNAVDIREHPYPPSEQRAIYCAQHVKHSADALADLRRIEGEFGEVDLAVSIVLAARKLERELVAANPPSTEPEELFPAKRADVPTPATLAAWEQLETLLARLHVLVEPDLTPGSVFFIVDHANIPGLRGWPKLREKTLEALAMWRGDKPGPDFHEIRLKPTKRRRQGI